MLSLQISETKTDFNSKFPFKYLISNNDPHDKKEEKKKNRKKIDIIRQRSYK
jgi:hypothetical protein